MRHRYASGGGMRQSRRCMSNIHMCFEILARQRMCFVLIMRICHSQEALRDKTAYLKAKTRISVRKAKFWVIYSRQLSYANVLSSISVWLIQQTDDTHNSASDSVGSNSWQKCLLWARHTLLIAREFESLTQNFWISVQFHYYWPY